MRSTRTLLIVPVVVLALVAAGCAAKSSRGAAPGAHRVSVQVTENGFEPALVTVPAGEPAVLVVKRVTDQTCATEFVMADRKITRPLPLGTEVEIPIDTAHKGDLHYACGMDMYRGVVRVQ